MLDPSQRVDDFEIIRPLGQGGMGVVYEAQQQNPSRRVALKVLAPWLGQNEEALARFRREVEVLAQLDHPGIVSVITTGRTPEGVAYYTMKLIRGISLAELVRTGAQAQSDAFIEPTLSFVDSGQATPSMLPGSTPIVVAATDGPPKQVIREYITNRFPFVVRVGIATAQEALQAAHDRGHLHRDIKPSNMMIDHHGQLYLVDFGLTRTLAPGGDVSQPGGIRGTPWYMSPEQARGQTLDERSDIYSLGVALYEMASCGTGPFTANRDDTESVLTQVRAGMLLPLRVLAPNIPRELERIILQAIQLKPKRRYQTANDLAADLERIIPSASGLVTPSKARGSSRSHWISLRWLIIAAILLLTMAVPFFWNRQSPRVESSGKLIQPTNTTTAPVEVAIKSNDPSPGGDYPLMLRNPPDGTAVPLLRGNMSPIWEHQRIHGDGFLNQLPGELLIMSPPDNPTAMVVALADSRKNDVARPWFEYSIELRQNRSDSPNDNQVGIFWGFRESIDSPQSMILLTAQISESPSSKSPHGRLTVGTSFVQLRDRSSGRQSINRWMTPFKTRGFAPLPESSRVQAGWRKIRLRVEEQTVTITVDESTSIELSSVAIQSERSDGAIDAKSLDSRGIMGIWARQGSGAFRNGTYSTIRGR